LDNNQIVTPEPNPSEGVLSTPAKDAAFDLAEITAPPLTSVAEIIDLSESLHAFDPFLGVVTTWAFRGQPRDFGTLVPSFLRQFSRRSFGTAEIIERRLIVAFREHYRDLNDRSADMPRPEQIDANHDLRCLSVMQHYEIPTRLLDWTSNFWTAVYFACASEPGSQAELCVMTEKCFKRSVEISISWDSTHLWTIPTVRARSLHSCRGDSTI
jgi:hypothetical protein